MNFIITYSCCERRDGGLPIFRFVIFALLEGENLKERAKKEVAAIKKNLGIENYPNSLQADSFSANLWQITPVQANIDRM